MAELILIFTVIFVPMDDNLIYMNAEKYSDILRVGGMYVNSKYGINMESFYVNNIPVTYMNEDSVIDVLSYKNYISSELDLYYNVYKNISAGGKIDLSYFTVFNVLFYPYIGYNSDIVKSGVYFSFDNRYIKEAYFALKYRKEDIYSYWGLYVIRDNNGIVLYDDISLYPIFYLLYKINKNIGLYIKRDPYIWEYGVSLRYEKFYFSLSIKDGYPYWSMPLGMGYYVE